MFLSRIASAFLGLCLSFAAQGAAAQSPGTNTYSFPWSLSTNSARAQGMAGVDLALSADVSAIGSNPAGLVQMPFRSVSAALRPMSFGVPNEELRASLRSAWSKPLNIDVAFRPWSSLAFGARLYSPGHYYFDFKDTVATGGAYRNVSLRSNSLLALVGSWKAHENLSLGSEVNWSELRFYSTRVGRNAAKTETSAGGSIGLLARFSRFRLAARVMRPGKWGREESTPAERESPFTNFVGGRVPAAVYSAGISWHHGLGWGQKLTLTGQVDHLRKPGAGFKNGTEYAFGAEFSRFRTRASEGNSGIQLRGGFRKSSEASKLVFLTAGAKLDAGTETRPPVSDISIGPSTISLGLTYIPSRKKTLLAGRTRFDLAASRTDAWWRWTAGVGFQFPRSMRRTILEN